MLYQGLHNPLVGYLYTSVQEITHNIIVDVFVTFEYILMYIIIVSCRTPIGDVFTLLRDVLIVYRPWGTTYFVSWGNSPQGNIM